MLKIFVRFLTIMLLIAIAYLVYINSKYTSLQQLAGKGVAYAELQSLPEIILPLKEENVGYQYELLKAFIKNIDVEKVMLNSITNDVEIFYDTQLCSRCVVVNKQDLLLVSNSFDEKVNNIELLNIYNNLKINNEITQNFKINYTNENIDDHIYNLSNNLISYSILTRSSYLFYKKYYPKLNIVRKIDTINLIWKFPNDDGTIVKELFSFLESDVGRNIIQGLDNKYYSRDTISSYIFIGSRLFISDMVTKLPEYEKLFKDTADKYNLDWKLLAAISYQESKWNNDSVSPTGVKGLMMLTEKTADMLNVNRTNVNESIDGGARYIIYLSNRFSNFKNETKLNLALAAYNVGPGHIDDIITLANNDNVNINEWKNLKIYLLKLNKKEFYKKMKYGYARGWEAVQYVENIKQYYDILSFLEDKDDQIKNNIIYEVPKTI